MLFHSFILSVYDNLFKRYIYYCLYLPISSMLRLLWQNSAGSVKQTPVNDVIMEIYICQICSDVINKVSSKPTQKFKALCQLVHG